MEAEIDPSIVTPGTAGALVVLGLAVATYFIVRGVLKHMRRIPQDDIHNGVQEDVRDVVERDDNQQQ